MTYWVVSKNKILREKSKTDLLREEIHATLFRINSSVNSANVSLVPDPVGGIEMGNNLNSSTSSQAVAKVKLPKLNLKKL